jgi:hypothetical protein
MPTPPVETPVLAPPGAGLPVPELWVARLGFMFARWGYNREAATDAFIRERQRIGELVANCPPNVASQRILIPRLRGLEDSSRHWSVWMTLDHLKITNKAFADIIRRLAQNVLPEREASTVAVKPSTEVSFEVIHAYEESCSELLNILSENANLATKLKFAHPWFGPMNAESWHLLAGVHMGIHRKQIEAILARVA